MLIIEALKLIGNKTYSIKNEVAERIGKIRKVATKPSDEKTLEYGTVADQTAKAEVEQCKRDNGIIITAFALRNDKLKSEVERLNKEFAAWDYGTSAKREQERAEKAEAEVERLRGSLRDQERSLGTSQFYLARAIEIAEIVGWTQNVAYLSELRAELDALKATINPDKK